jgi:hypothetical protein
LIKSYKLIPFHKIRKPVSFSFNLIDCICYQSSTHCWLIPLELWGFLDFFSPSQREEHLGKFLGQLRKQSAQVLSWKFMIFRFLPFKVF